MRDNGSFWFASLDDSEDIASPEWPEQVDVAIIGGGYTGLWTAYYLQKARPELSIAVFEAEHFGFGASGRNGGWCMGTSHDVEHLLQQPDRQPIGVRLAREMQSTVDEIGRVSASLGIDCHFHKGGNLTVATRSFQLRQFEDEVRHLHKLGFDEADFRLLTPSESGDRVGMTDNFGALYTSHCAVIHPARLAQGLARSVKNAGANCQPNTRVLGYQSGQVATDRGVVRAGRILRATEGFTETIKGCERQVLPIYSMMISTEPLPNSVWARIGLAGRETFADPRRVVIYGQRTADDRIAFGGRGGYYYGSDIKPIIDSDHPNLDAISETLRSLFPVLRDYKVTHRWGGPLGVHRHWRPTVEFDADTGLGSAGGYVGEGVAASNLAARILTDLVLGEQTPLTDLPWVNDVSRRWEAEPIRFFGTKAVEFLAERGDASEWQRNQPSKVWGRLFDVLTR